MFDKNTFLQHTTNIPGHNKMTQAGVKAPFSLQEQGMISGYPEEEWRAKRKQLEGLFLDKFGLPYAPDAGMHFVAHFDEHPEYGKLYLGRGNIVTNNPQEAAPKGDGGDLMGIVGTKGGRGLPMQPRFKINGQMIDHRSEEHKALVDHIRAGRTHAEPRLAFNRETTEAKINKFHAQNAYARIMNPEITLNVKENPEGNRAKLRRLEQQQQQEEE